MDARTFSTPGFILEPLENFNRKLTQITNTATKPLISLCVPCARHGNITPTFFLNQLARFSWNLSQEDNMVQLVLKMKDCLYDSFTSKLCQPSDIILSHSKLAELSATSLPLEHNLVGALSATCSEDMQCGSALTDINLSAETHGASALFRTAYTAPDISHDLPKSAPNQHCNLLHLLLENRTILRGNPLLGSFLNGLKVTTTKIDVSEVAEMPAYNICVAIPSLMSSSSTRLMVSSSRRMVMFGGVPLEDKILLGWDPPMWQHRVLLGWDPPICRYGVLLGWDPPIICRCNFVWFNNIP
jgi:hypothetical protein